MSTVTMNPGTTYASRWTVDSTQHADCAECGKAARAAASTAVATGSRSASYGITPGHYATVTRA